MASLIRCSAVFKGLCGLGRRVVGGELLDYTLVDEEVSGNHLRSREDVEYGSELGWALGRKCWRQSLLARQPCADLHHSDSNPLFSSVQEDERVRYMGFW